MTCHSSTGHALEKIGAEQERVAQKVLVLDLPSEVAALD
jgi:hypothetical protein